MAAIDDQYDAAMDKLRLHVQPDVPPTLSAAELRALLTGDQRASIWIASTAYNYGDVILPTVRNGHRYRCTQAGTSGATEPTWLTSTEAVLSEGASDPQLLWIEDGSDYANAFNVRAAIHAAWMMKAAKSSALYGSGRANAQQVYDHCVSMAERYASLEIA